MEIYRTKNSVFSHSGHFSDDHLWLTAPIPGSADANTDVIADDSTSIDNRFKEFCCDGKEKNGVGAKRETLSS